MKKLLLLLLLFTGMVNAQIVNIPDANFKAKLIALNIDTNGDGNIQNVEALNVTIIDVTNSNISDLTGIRSFLNLVELECDFNQLTTLNVSNLLSLTKLYCNDNNISALNFNQTSLYSLNCNNNELTTLNVSNLPNLGFFECKNNNLTSLSFGGITSLYLFDCSYNLLTNLNASNLSNSSVQLPIVYSFDCSNNLLTELLLHPSMNGVNCKNNLLTSLDFSNRGTIDGYCALNCSNNLLINLNITGSSISTLDCSNNQLTSIDFTNYSTTTTLDGSDEVNCSNNQLSSIIFNNTNINSLNLNNNSLTSLDFTNCSLSNSLLCSSNPITSLILGVKNVKNVTSNNTLLQTIDISGCKQIISLDVSNNNLETIFAKNGRNEFINFTNNPNLIYICGDDEQISSFVSVALPSTNVNSYCSFVPGGPYNTINGVARFDQNNNGCETTDIGFNNVRINISDGFESGATFTNSIGNYSVFSQSTDFTLMPSLENPTYFSITPANATVNFNGNNFLTQLQDFCVTPNGINPDLEVVLAPVGQAFQGFESNYILVYKNKGNQVLSGDVNLSFDNMLSSFVASSPVQDNFVDNVLTWNFSNLLPFESKTIQITLDVNGSFGDVLNFTTTINPILVDILPLDNVFNFTQTISNEYYPYTITCLEGDNVAATEIGNYLHYNVDFDNTGTEPVQSIVARLVIDTSKFDIGTLQVVNTSESMRTRITNNIVEFIFENINLPRASGNPPVGGHGNVLFKIKTKSNLVAGTSVSANSNIFFDYSFPVLTNNATTTFASLSNSILKLDKTISVYPNPTNSIINIGSDNTIKSIEVYDIQGRILETVLGNTKTIDISSKQNGIYFFKISTEKGSIIEKIIKE